MGVQITKGLQGHAKRGTENFNLEVAGSHRFLSRGETGWDFRKIILTVLWRIDVSGETSGGNTSFSSVFQEKCFKEIQASAGKFRDPCGRQWPSDFVFFFSIALAWGFPGGTTSKEPACQCKRCRRRRFNPGVGKIPRRRQWQPTPVFLPGESHGQRSLAGYSPCGP